MVCSVHFATPWLHLLCYQLWIKIHIIRNIRRDCCQTVTVQVSTCSTKPSTKTSTSVSCFMARRTAPSTQSLDSASMLGSHVMHTTAEAFTWPRPSIKHFCTLVKSLLLVHCMLLSILCVKDLLTSISSLSLLTLLSVFGKNFIRIYFIHVVNKQWHFGEVINLTLLK